MICDVSQANINWYWVFVRKSLTLRICREIMCLKGSSSKNNPPPWSPDTGVVVVVAETEQADERMKLEMLVNLQRLCRVGEVGCICKNIGMNELGRRGQANSEGVSVFLSVTYSMFVLYVT